MQDHLSSALRDKIEILTLIQDDETGNMAWHPAESAGAQLRSTGRGTFFPSRASVPRGRRS